MYNYRRQDRTDKYPNNVCTTTVDPRRLRGRQVSRRDPEHLRSVYNYETCTTTSTTARVPLASTLEDSVDVKFLVVTPNVMCTTTVAVYHYFHYDRRENDYFHYRRHVNNDFHYAVFDYFPRRPENDYFLYRRRVPLLPPTLHRTRSAPKTHSSKV